MSRPYCGGRCVTISPNGTKDHFSVYFYGTTTELAPKKECGFQLFEKTFVIGFCFSNSSSYFGTGSHGELTFDLQLTFSFANSSR